MRTIYFERNIPKILLVKALRPLWPGVVFSRLAPTRLAEIAEQPLPGAEWVRVRNRLCGICATDIHLFQAETDPKVTLAALPGQPRVYLGHEVVSDVVEVGPAVRGLKVGDRVAMDSRASMGPTCLSQGIEPPCRYCAAGNPVRCENVYAGKGPWGAGGGWGDGYTAHASEVYPVPDDLTDEQAAMLEPLSIGVHTVLRRPPAPGEQVLIVGAGIVGLNVLQSVRALGIDCHITIMARYRQQIEMAQRLGADEIVSGEDAYEAVARLTGGQLFEGMFHNRTIMGGFDVVYDSVGSAQTIGDSLRWTRGGGAVVVVGVTFAPLTFDLSPVWHQEVDLVGSMMHGLEKWEGEERPAYDLVCDLLRQRKLTVDGFITHRFPLERWHEAIRTAQDKRSGAIKVVFDYRDHLALEP